MRVLSVLCVLLVATGPLALARPPMKWSSLVLLRSAAEKGNADAQFLLGMQYKAGDGVPQDRAEAAKWFRQSAEAGNAEAQNALGVLQAETGDPADAPEATKWLKAAAEQGNAEAMFNLGALYARNLQPGADSTEALRWYVQAATAGRADAARALAEMYARGQGVVRDPVQAVEWYRKAAALGDVESQVVVGRVDAVTKAVKDDPARALAAWRSEAEKGDLGAALALELIARQSRRTDDDPAATVRWSLLLSGLRGPEAHVVRGFLLESGVAVNQDPVAAAASYRKAADLGYAAGQYRLGLLYAGGRGVEKDLVEAAVWLGLAAANGSPEAAAAFAEVRDGLTADQRAAVEKRLDAQGRPAETPRDNGKKT